MGYAIIRKDLREYGVPVISTYGQERYLHDSHYDTTPAQFLYEQPEILESEEYNLIIRDQDGFVWLAMSIDFDFIEEEGD